MVSRWGQPCFLLTSLEHVAMGYVEFVVGLHCDAAHRSIDALATPIEVSEL